jgi:hypothetical protein
MLNHHLLCPSLLSDTTHPTQLIQCSSETTKIYNPPLTCIFSKTRHIPTNFGSNLWRRTSKSDMPLQSNIEIVHEIGRDNFLSHISSFAVHGVLTQAPTLRFSSTATRQIFERYLVLILTYKSWHYYSFTSGAGRPEFDTRQRLTSPPHPDHSSYPIGTWKPFSRRWSDPSGWRSWQATFV